MFRHFDYSFVSHILALVWRLLPAERMFRRSLRKPGRQLPITGAVAMQFDRLARWRECREVRRSRDSVVRVLYFHSAPAAQADVRRRRLSRMQGPAEDARQP